LDPSKIGSKLMELSWPCIDLAIEGVMIVKPFN
jgi:hypothetical protein